MAENFSKYTIRSEKSNANMLSKFVVYNPRFQEGIIYTLRKLIFRYAGK